MNRIKSRQEAKAILANISSSKPNTLIIHYSCESFYDIKDGKTPRITSICVRNFSSGQTYSFSIHKVAEIKRIEINQVDKNYDACEKEMLKNFFTFVKENSARFWAHWNMRDENYGFQAIEHRYRVLGGKNPYILPDSKKIDLSRLLIDLYGTSYISHPRLEKLVDKNNIAKKEFLSGADEAKAFQDKEFIKLHQSTLRKADILANILERILNNSILTNAKWQEIYGLNAKNIMDFVNNHPIIKFLTIISAILGLIVLVCNMFFKLYGIK